MGMTIKEIVGAVLFATLVTSILRALWVWYDDVRLKADMVAMLEDLDLQIDESAAYNLEVAKVQRLIRDRIDKLKEDK